MIYDAPVRCQGQALRICRSTASKISALCPAARPAPGITPPRREIAAHTNGSGLSYTHSGCTACTHRRRACARCAARARPDPRRQNLGLPRDISPDQIAAARSRCADLAWVECRTADIAAPPYADGEFDALVAVQALEYLADLDGALRIIHRMLKPGGRLIMWRRIGARRYGTPRMRRACSGY